MVGVTQEDLTYGFNRTVLQVKCLSKIYVFTISTNVDLCGIQDTNTQLLTKMNW